MTALKMLAFLVAMVVGSLIAKWVIDACVTKWIAS